MVATLPGRSQGLGLITEPLLTELGLDRVTYATMNFWATIVGALGAIGVGRVMDRFGSRIVLTVIVAALAAVVAVMSQAASIVTLVATLTATRALGQSALSVVSISMIGYWFRRRINTAMAIYSVGLSIGFMIAFPVVGALVQSSGWRTAWLNIAIALAVFAPIAWLTVRSTPQSIGVTPDGNEPAEQNADGMLWTDALRTGAFWVFAIGASLYGLVASGIGLFNESILAERGFGADVYYQTLIVTAMTSLVGNFLGGWLATRMLLTRLMSLALLMLAAGLATLPMLASFAMVMTWAAAMGVAGGIVMVLFFSVWPAVFGRRHLGQIQGTAQAATVLASAIGPVLLAWCVTTTGSYAGIFWILATVTAVVAAAAALVSREVSAVVSASRTV